MAPAWQEPPGWRRRLSEKSVVAGGFDDLRDNPTKPRTQQSAARVRLNEHCERLAWGAYLRARRLQEAEPGPITTIIRNSVYTAWARAFLALEST